MIGLTKPINVMDIKLRTTNDNGQSFKDIPPFWGQFMAEDIVGKVNNKLNNNIYVLYTHFEHEGINNTGMYSTIIGCAVETNAIEQAGLVHAVVPAGEYRQFSVPDNNPENVGPVWLGLWGLADSEKVDWSFLCEYECYQPDELIDVFVGLR